MQQEGVQPNPITFVGVLYACTNIAAVEEGRYAHELLFQSGCHSDVFVGNSLVDMYVECGSVEDAQTVFNKMPSQDVVTAMILAHVNCMQGMKALKSISTYARGCATKLSYFVGLLNACASEVALERGQVCS
jgi:pentatricopeptide repeat protein